MKKSMISFLAILLGVIILIFPMLGIIGAQAIIGVAVLLMGVFLLISGTSEIDYSPKKSIATIIIGIIILILGLLLIFSPNAFVYLAGILLIIVGLMTLIGNRDRGFGFWSGVIGVILGIIYIILGSTVLKNPIFLGALIGIWLIITGILRFADNS